MIDLPGVPVIAAVDDATIEEEIRNSPPKLKKLRLSGPDDANDAGETTPSAAKKSRMSSSAVDEPFHGFLPSDVPARVVIIPDGDTDVSLTAAFGVDLIDDGLELTADDVTELAPKAKSLPSVTLTPVAMPTVVAPVTLTSVTPAPAPTTVAPAVSATVTPATLTPVPAKRSPAPAIIVPMSSIAPKVTPEPKKPLPALKPLPGPMVRESREWKPSAQFYKPLNAGKILYQCANWPSSFNQFSELWTKLFAV